MAHGDVKPANSITQSFTLFSSSNFAGYSPNNESSTSSLLRESPNRKEPREVQGAIGLGVSSLSSSSSSGLSGGLSGGISTRNKQLLDLSNKKASSAASSAAAAAAASYHGGLYKGVPPTPTESYGGRDGYVTPDEENDNATLSSMSTHSESEYSDSDDDYASETGDNFMPLKRSRRKKKNVTVSYTYDAFFISDGRSRKRQLAREANGASPPVPESKERTRYTCTECGKHYATSSNLSRHKQTHRSPDSQLAKKCPTCNKVYVSMPALAMHVVRIGGGGPFFTLHHPNTPPPPSVAHPQFKSQV